MRKRARQVETTTQVITRTRRTVTARNGLNRNYNPVDCRLEIYLVVSEDLTRTRRREGPTQPLFIQHLSRYK